MTVAPLGAGAEPRIVFLASRQRTGPAIDPRTKLLALLVINVMVMGYCPLDVTIGCATVAAVLSGSAARDRFWRNTMMLMVVSLVVSQLGPRAMSSAVMVGICVVAFWIARFCIAVLMASHVVRTVSSSELIAALRAIRCPSSLVTLIVVTLRFIPLTVRELRAIVDAMRLRRVLPSGWAILAHPSRTCEHVLVPLLTSTTRLIDDLAAAGVIRGLGGPCVPSSRTRLSFHRGDALLLAVLGLLAARALLWRTGIA